MHSPQTWSRCLPPRLAWLWVACAAAACAGCENRVGDGPPASFDDAAVGDAGVPDGSTGDAGAELDLGAPLDAGHDQGVTSPDNGVAPDDVAPDALPLADGATGVTLAASHELLYRVEVPRGEHVGFRFDFAPTTAAVTMTVERYDGVGPAYLGLTNGGRGIRTLAVFEPGSGAIDFEARGETRVLLGSAARHEHPLVLGTSSVHTDRAALDRSLARIRDIGTTLRAQGRV